MCGACSKNKLFATPLHTANMESEGIAWSSVPNKCTSHPGFVRLKWSIFDDISGIQVFRDAEDGSFELRPFTDDAIRTELATSVPLTCMPIEIDILSECDESWKDDGSCFPTMETHSEDAGGEAEEPQYYRSPESLIVKRDDGGPITVEDVVEQVHPYLNKYRHDIVHWTNETTGEKPPETKHFFHWLMEPPYCHPNFPREGDDNRVSSGFCFYVHIFREENQGGGIGTTEAMHWEMVKSGIRARQREGEEI